MGRQIIKQPNGLYAVYSSIVDHFVLYDATVEGLIEEAVSEAREQAERNINRVVELLEAGEKPYHQFTMSWDEAVKWTRTVHGKDVGDLDAIIKAAATPVETEVNSDASE